MSTHFPPRAAESAVESCLRRAGASAFSDSTYPQALDAQFRIERLVMSEPVYVSTATERPAKFEFIANPQFHERDAK